MAVFRVRGNHQSCGRRRHCSKLARDMEHMYTHVPAPGEFGGMSTPSSILVTAPEVCFQTHFAVRTRTTMCNDLNMANTRKSWLRAPTSEARFVISVKICI